ncbi:MAG: nicotinate-nucleotide adenylyltransferase [Bacteroidales bacterium]|nr:nicotinate-nucleotide adenylyltransferase [Bacteroidales bacterium]
MIRTGLFFGSFNPIHIGHMAIANYMLEFSEIEHLWFVVSPQNPLKEKRSLLAGYHRLELTRLAVDDDDRFDVSDIEFNMPKPSYTIDTLTYLEEKHPKREFLMIMGSDGLRNFHRWKNASLLQEKYHRLVYPRPGMTCDEISTHSNITLMDAPLMEISSSFIRDSIKEGKDVKYFLPPKTYQYIKEMHFYEK